MRKLFTLLLAVAASVGISANDYGTCGPDLRWTYDSQTHELVIGGSGPMYDYSYHGAPWSPYREDITSVSFVEDVSIPNFPFVAPTEGAVTLVWYIANIYEMCDEVGYVFAGNYNNWNTADVEAMAHFEPIPGHIGWFKAVIPQVDGVDHLEGKPCALQKDGTFNSSWDNQWIGTEYHPCEIISGSAELQIEYDVEARLVCAADADVVYVKSYAFKTNPCVDAVYDQVTFNLTVETPVTSGGTVYIVGDAFEKTWDQTAYPMTGSGSYWTITLPAIVGKSYKFCVNADWVNDQMILNTERDCVEKAANMKVDFTTMESTVYGFMNFGITEDQVCQEEVVEGVMYIKCAGNGWIWTQMTVDPEDNTKFTYESTVADADHVGANIGVTNAAEGQWYDLGTADANGLAEGDAVVYTFVSTVGATGNLSVVKKVNTGYDAPIRNKKTESATPQITSIGAYAFSGCSGLSSMAIPNGVTSIGDGAFDGCRNLNTITNYANIPQPLDPDGISVFGGVPLTCTLYVPAESVASYQAADVWKDFYNILPIGGGDTPSPEERTGQSTEGKDFWVTFMQADQDPNNDLVLSLSISSREDCQVMISNPYTGYMENIYVLADQPQKVELYSGNVLLANARTTMANSGKVCYAGYSEQVDTCALRVTATSDISLFATNYKRATFDATNVLPTALLGDEYFIQTYTPSDHAGVGSSQGSHFAIIATEDNTIVDYCPTVMTQAVTDSVNVAQAKRDFMGEDALTEREKLWLHYTIGDTLHTPMLMAGQVFYVWTGKADGETGDLSGTYVKARNGKRIAVFQGNPHTNIPYQVKQRDQLYSQAMPVQSWGSTFALTASAERPSDIIRVMALYDGTEVRINGETVHTFDFTVDTKHFWEFEIGPSGTYAQDGSCMLTTSQPVAVHLFLTSQRHHGDSQSNGDPAMLWVSPIEQQMEQVNFVTNDSRNGVISNYLNVVTDRPNSMTLDNISITSHFSPVSGSNTYHYAQIALGSAATAHTLKCNGGRFNAHVYGFTNNESYGYSVGGFIEDLTASIYINGEQVSPVNDMCVSDTFFMDITTSFDYQSMKLDFGDGIVVYATDEEGIHARHAYDAPGVYHANVVVASNNNRLDSISIRIFAGTLSLTYEPLNDIYVGDSIFYIYYHSPIQEMQIEEDFTIDRSFNDAALQDGFGHYTTRLNRSFFGIRIPEGARAGVEYAFNVDIHTPCGDYTATIPFVLKARRTGSCGDNLALTWTYDPETKTLTITGDGALNSNYTFGLEAPLEMEHLIIAEGVTSIGANAFSNMSTLQTMQLPASLKTIGASAFENDINLTAIYNYRERPCLVDATAFNGVNKFDCTLYVLEGSVDMYKSSISDWKDFYFILPIGTTEVTEPVSDVTVEPHDNTAVVTWPTTANAATYTIEITKDGVVFCRLIFNAYGQLIGIAFAPGREGVHHAMAATMTTGGMQFTVTGLNSNTNYSYTVVVKDESEETISSYAGEFTTTGEDSPTGVEGIQPSEVSYRKLLRNGQIFILRGEKVYNAQGALVK